MNNVVNYQDYINIINTLKEALKFYADDENYKQNTALNNELVSKVEMDGGHQAKYALNVIKHINKTDELHLLEDIERYLENTNQTFNNEALKQQLDEIEKQMKEVADKYKNNMK